MTVKPLDGHVRAWHKFGQMVVTTLGGRLMAVLIGGVCEDANGVGMFSAFANVTFVDVSNWKNDDPASRKASYEQCANPPVDAAVPEAAVAEVAGPGDDPLITTVAELKRAFRGTVPSFAAQSKLYIAALIRRGDALATDGGRTQYTRATFIMTKVPSGGILKSTFIAACLAGF